MIIAQELIHSLKSRKGKDGYIVVKINLEKAYDLLEWSFIKMVLEHFNFPKNIINLIMSCIPHGSLKKKKKIRVLSFKYMMIYDRVFLKPKNLGWLLCITGSS